ncbi:hem peroxidase [Dillenia turbinata]|uniref:Peroxidase n=1 Tax=Dillenia turbinata TaxID=194707 RepID=A0AAN8YUK8_9MAGN
MRLATLVLVTAFLATFHHGVEGGGLSYDFYTKSCPQLEGIVRASLQNIFLTDPTAPAALLRLMFHDCQVQGCDASILLDQGSGNLAPEMASSRNLAIQKREAINAIKTMTEMTCPGQVSCADIVILAAREAVSMSGGPRIRVPLGRRDSKISSYRLADASLPHPNAGVSDVLTIFAKKGMTIEESVAILGAHTLGVTHCFNVLDRLNRLQGGSESVRDINGGFLLFLRLSCPQMSLNSNMSFVPNDPSMFAFDNQYYAMAMSGRGVLRVDAEMASDRRTARVMSHFSVNQDAFFRAFSSAFVKLSASGVLTGNQGVIRRTCNLLD